MNTSISPPLARFEIPTNREKGGRAGVSVRLHLSQPAAYKEGPQIESRSPRFYWFHIPSTCKSIDRGGEWSVKYTPATCRFNEFERWRFQRVLMKESRCSFSEIERCTYSRESWFCLLIRAFFLLTSMNHSCIMASSSSLLLPGKVTQTRLQWHHTVKIWHRVCVRAGMKETPKPPGCCRVSTSTWYLCNSSVLPVQTLTYFTPHLHNVNTASTGAGLTRRLLSSAFTEWSLSL